MYPNNSTIRSTLETTTHRPPTKSIQFRMSLLSSFDCMHPMFSVPYLFISTLPNQYQSTRVMASVPSSSIFRLIQPIHVNHRSPQLHSSSVHSYRQPVSLLTLILSERSRASEKDATELSHFISISHTPSMRNRINAKQNAFPHSHLPLPHQNNNHSFTHLSIIPFYARFFPNPSPSSSPYQLLQQTLSRILTMIRCALQPHGELHSSFPPFLPERSNDS